MGVKWRSKGWFRWLIWSTAGGIIVLTFIVWTVFATHRRDYHYLTQVVDRGDVVRRVAASGKVRAFKTIKVGAEVSGQIISVNADFNSPVIAGQLLAEIDPTRFRARVQQAQAQVATAQAAFAQAEAAASRAGSELILQKREFARRNILAHRGFVSTSSLEAATTALASAQVGVRTTSAQIASARAGIALAEAELLSAHLDLSRTRIIAPSRGVVINRLVDPGATVAASFQTPNLFEIAIDTRRMQVEASVDEADIGQVRVGQPVRFTVDSYPEVQFRSTVRQIRQAAIEMQNTVNYLVILDVDNADGRLMPGMTANVEIITGRKVNVPRIPVSALRFRPRREDQQDAPLSSPTQSSVYVATRSANRPARRPVRLGLISDDFAEVTNGVAVGDSVLLRIRTDKSEASTGDGTDDDTSH